MGARMRRSYPPGCHDHRMSTVARSPDAPVFRLDGQVALVTGAARGLGRAISLALAHAGADVALGLRDKNTGRDVVREIEKLGRKALPVQMNMSNLGQISSGINQAAAHFAKLDILVNNAG